jgi:lipoprotein-anchoring transpeptidase ErfK/SrfK
MTYFFRNYSLVLFAALATPTVAQERYSEPAPLTVSPAASNPWIMQLREARQVPPPAQAQPRQAPPSARTQPRQVRPAARTEPRPAPSAAQTQPRVAAPESQPSIQSAAASQQIHQHYQPPQTVGRRPLDYSHFPMEPRFLPQEVPYVTKHSAGTIVVDTKQKYLYLVLPGGMARRYGVGVGKEGYGWTGSHRITNKREWPDWRPPAEMIERERELGIELPVHMAGGPLNPLGARALYLGSTLYRIHGTNAPWTIGQSVSSGCIRMRNEDVIDLYDRVQIGANVVVI